MSTEERAYERAGEASNAKQANERAERVNEQADKRMAQYSTRRFHILSTHCAPPPLNKQNAFTIFTENRIS